MKRSTSPLPRCAVWEERTEAKNKGGRSRLKSVPAKVYVQWEEGQRAPQCSPTGQTSPLRSGVAAVSSPANRVQEAACLVVA